MLSSKFWLSIYCLSASLAVAVSTRYVVKELYSHGHKYSEDWGSWGEWEFCPYGLHAWRVSVKWVQDLGPHRDDFSTTGISLWCGVASREVGYNITSSVGSFGDWEPFQECGMWLSGFQVAVQPWQGHGGDDTALNSVQFFCMFGRDLEFPTTPWGIWEEELLCPPASAICGIKTQVEDYHHSDAAGLIRVAVACCRFEQNV